MKRDDIVRMARDAGFIDADQDSVWITDGFWTRELERFAALVAAAEREACAAICDTTPPYPFRPSIEAAHAIRARSNP